MYVYIYMCVGFKYVFIHIYVCRLQVCMYTYIYVPVEFKCVCIHT